MTFLRDDSDVSLDRMRTVLADLWQQAPERGVSATVITRLVQHGGSVIAVCRTPPPPALVALIEDVLKPHGLYLYDCEVQS